MSQRKFSKNISNVSSVKTNQNEMTPRVKKTSKSPISHSKCNHQTAGKQTVSYGELQIVLENIQTIKQKASNQIKQLNQENITLREQITQMQSCIDKLTRQINEEKMGQGTVEERWKKKNFSLEEQLEQAKKKIEEKERTIDTLNSKVRQLERNLRQEKEDFSEHLQELQDLKKKWSWAFMILAGDETRAEEIVWKIKHSSCNLWQIFQKISTLENILDLKTQKLESLTSELSQCKQQYRKTSGMLDKALTELNSTNEKIKAGDNQIQQYYHKFLEFKEVKLSLEEIIHELRRDKVGLCQTIESLEQKVKILSESLVRKELDCVQKDKKLEYQDLVSQICDQTEDYGKVLDRLKYLQRFRKEYYFNIQKIQFLCKLLDN